MGDCSHAYPEIHLIGTRTIVACSECLVVLEHDIPLFIRST